MQRAIGAPSVTGEKTMNMNAGTQATDSKWVAKCTKQWLAQFWGCTNKKQDDLTLFNLCQFIKWFNEHNGIA